MGSDVKKKMGDHTIQLEIPMQQRDDTSIRRWGSTLFEPGTELSNQTPSIKGNPTYLVPEKKLALFALRLAILEKSASGLGKLAFIWATVVLLGGFASSLQTKDFWFVTAILVVEGTRIYSRSHELEWEHQATKSSSSRNSFRAFVSSSRSIFRAIEGVFRQKPSPRLSQNVHLASQDQNQSVVDSKENTSIQKWLPSNIPLLPHGGWLFLSTNVSRMLLWLQLLSATACAALSLVRLIKQHYGETSNSSQEIMNRKNALNIFYALSLTEALMFLLEKGYWSWKVTHAKLIENVCKQCDLGEAGIIPAKRFLYDSYSSCINGSIFDGLKMDLISFAEDLLDSNFRDEQLIGAQILEKFVSNRYADYTLRKIGTNTRVIERLIEMLNWKNPDEEAIRKSAAEVISKLAGKKQNALRVAGMIGAMESISSLLHTSKTPYTKPHEISSRFVVPDQMDYEYSVFNLLGLLILKKLARDHDNCGMIGNSRGLLAKIIDFTSASQGLLRNDLAPESQIKAVRRSLQLVKMLVSTTGPTGKALRKDISEIVFTVSNIRDILQYGESHLVLQKLGIEIITNLAMDDDAKEEIGNTGGVIRLLLSIFLKPGVTAEQNSVSDEAGEALAMLALESKKNSSRILKDRQVVEQLVAALDEPVLQVNSSRILRNLCAYTGKERFEVLRGVTAALPTVLKTIMVQKDKLLEVSTGLATKIFNFTSPEAYDEVLAKAGIEDVDFAERLVQILKIYKYPEIKVPRIRLFVIELVIEMMTLQTKNIQLLKNLAMEEALDWVAETTSELESFNVFSGSVGICRHKISLSSLIETAQDLIAKA